MAVDVQLSDTMAETIAKIEGGAAHFIAQLAMRVRDTYKDNLHVGYGVDTGAMQESASAVTSEGSDYGQHVAAAAAMNPLAQFAPEPQLADRFEAATVVPVHYAALFEFGGGNSPAHPALVPAVELVASQADNIALEVFDIR